MRLDNVTPSFGNVAKIALFTAQQQQGQSVNKEYLSQIQLYSIFGELLVLSNTVVTSHK